MQAQAALVGADGGVELDAVAAVDLDLALVVHPRHAEDNDALGLHQALQQAGLLVLGVCVQRGLQGSQHLGSRLDELRLIGIAGLEVRNDPLGIVHVFLLSDSAPRRVFSGEPGFGPGPCTMDTIEKERIRKCAHMLFAILM